MASELTEQPVCASCNSRETSSKLLRCQKCKKVAYCNKTCQLSDWPSHKPSCKAPNYILKIHLCPSDITSPPVFRTLSCPAAATFKNLHYAIQIAFGWANIHTYDFKIQDPNAEPEAELSLMEFVRRKTQQLVVTNKHRAALEELPRQNFLRIIQDTPRGHGFGVLGGPVDMMHNQDRMHSQTPEVLSSSIRLCQVFENKEYGAGEIQVEYEYDFGDGWKHEIRIIGRRDVGPFQVLDGEAHGVAEDVGGASAWEELKGAYRAANPNKKQKEKMEWFENRASNRDPWGLGHGLEEYWDEDEINKKLRTRSA
ncbi:hypothetical protein HYALB_00002683 [Hymenoscyphus albidus]|uniref:MYND-type domain-containing protein n=1 Tax=Hymenoscyphus albidus TaxID=595503 RepID=A0A9N9M0S1_9HELO|nr:hypothetical protein HYALB_00002683 [Hymenoscyphus albidus]